MIIFEFQDSVSEIGDVGFQFCQTVLVSLSFTIVIFTTTFFLNQNIVLLDRVFAGFDVCFKSRLIVLLLVYA